MNIEAYSADDNASALTAAEWRDRLRQASVGLETKGQGFTHAPVSLSPWRLSDSQWQQALEAADLLGRLSQLMVRDRSWLLEHTAGLEASDSVPGTIWRLLSLIPTDQVQTVPVALQRHDLLMDTDGLWRWVETNPIAAGMGPLNQRWLETLATVQPAFYATNPAIKKQSFSLADGARRLAAEFGSDSPMMVMVVTDDEDNIYDQQLLTQEVERQGVSVLRLTLKEFSAAASYCDQRLFLPDGRRVDLIYWRTGYNAEDYSDDTLWQFRAKLEQTRIAQCPDLASQLSGSKWLQHVVSRQVHYIDGFADYFGLDERELALLQQLCLHSYSVADLSVPEFHRLVNQGYWYKTQHEGGGSVARGLSALTHYASRDAADILMANIDAAVRSAPISKLVNGELIRLSFHISELGIFTLGLTSEYGGYLCRTKAQHSLEGGVHRGGAVLDTLVIAKAV
ncbi:glutathione synthase [Pseudidiomarina sp.]|uniref:glutathione synthase n=1 Tax=Pseudidiomarina sp. TaxID=2081707 RepID=UPI00299DBC47|nr:glutathione synthase [Pseudidiomarina sp.]MDX1705569.1 glutathione synthase [Pseudidiomarina sp.]